MTKNEAIKKEIQKYHSLEAKLNGISVEQVVNAFIERIEKETNEGYECGRILTNKEAKMWKEYQTMGTPEEIKQKLIDAYGLGQEDFERE